MSGLSRRRLPLQGMFSPPVRSTRRVSALKLNTDPVNGHSPDGDYSSTMLHRDVCSAVILLLLALATGLQALRFPLGNLKKVGPGFFPIVLSVALGCLSFALLIKGLCSREKERVKWPAQWTAIILVLVAVFAYSFLLKPLGFLLATLLFTFSVFKLADPGRWAIPLLGSVTTTGLSLLLFKVWLAIPLPRGFMGY